jgi:hypothetical protein
VFFVNIFVLNKENKKKNGCTPSYLSSPQLLVKEIKEVPLPLSLAKDQIMWAS